jgi:hypothetical protein
MCRRPLKVLPHPAAEVSGEVEVGGDRRWSGHGGNAVAERSAEVKRRQTGAVGETGRQAGDGSVVVRLSFQYTK